MKNFTKTFFTLMVTTASMLPIASMADSLDVGEGEALGFSAAVNDAELDTYRGTFDNVTLFSSNFSANLQGNSSSNSVSGANSIGEGAFSNAAGLTTVIQNSGNNVIVQSSTMVNVNLQQ